MGGLGNCCRSRDLVEGLRLRIFWRVYVSYTPKRDGQRDRLFLLRNILVNQGGGSNMVSTQIPSQGEGGDEDGSDGFSVQTGIVGEGCDMIINRHSICFV